jgi:hypothetical protein
MSPQSDILDLAIQALPDKIVEIRGQRVMLDADLAELFGVPTKRFNEQIKRNLDRFPSDFMFILTKQEIMNLKSQFATSSEGHGGRRHSPRAFTEHGAIMAATVLNSPRAVEMSVYIVRAFVRLRELVSSHRNLSSKFRELEERLDSHDQTIGGLIQAIKALMEPETPKKRTIGYVRGAEDVRTG